jgi:chromosomal replication initiation ATPase DnaA
MQQQVLPLGHATAMQRADFLVSNCNALVLAKLDAWPDGTAETLIVTGPSGCGKTHLLHIWAKKAGAGLIEASNLDADLLDSLMKEPRPLAIDHLDAVFGSPLHEQALFHLYNRWREAGVSLVLAVCQPLGIAPIHLPDLASRLRALPAVAVEPPDDLLLARILAKLFADRQITVAANVVGYLVSRMERSFSGAGELVDRLDRAALAEGKPITMALARTIFNHTASKML